MIPSPMKNSERDMAKSKHVVDAVRTFATLSMLTKQNRFDLAVGMEDKKTKKNSFYEIIVLVEEKTEADMKRYNENINAVPGE